MRLRINMVERSLKLRSAENGLMYLFSIILIIRNIWAEVNL